MNRPTRVITGHKYTFTAGVIVVVAFLALPASLGLAPRLVFAWDLGAIAMLVMAVSVFMSAGDDGTMARNALAQQEGEWTVFFVTLAGIFVSFAALSSVLGIAKNMPQSFARNAYILVVALTLFLSWLLTHAIFALRYAHEYYERQPGASRVDGGLDFPGGLSPDYWDFFYFALVLGMTFQVSDVEITSRKLRRLAAAHGLIGFLFNATIIALTVNIAANLL